MLSVIEDKFKSASISHISKYEIILQDGKKLSVPDIENILSQDNTVKNPIMVLAIKYEGSNGDSNSQCELVYRKKRSNIFLEIKSKNERWAKELFAEVEEQIERTILSGSIYFFKREGFSDNVAVFLGIIMAFILFAAIILIPTPKKSTFFLSESNVKELLTLSQNANSTDEKINLLYESHVSQLNNLSSKSTTESLIDSIKNINLQTVFILIPLVVILVVSGYIVKYCYPCPIFLWGDHETYYNSIINRRRTLWNVIVSALVIGILGNIFAIGFSQYISK